jgi:hypothetical protein
MQHRVRHATITAIVAHRLATLLLVTILTACSAPTTERSAAPSTHEGHAADPATDAIKAELGERFGMTFASAGPHHELGKAQNGVQLDLVGVPPEQVILSVPSDEPGRVEQLAAPYLPYLPRLLNEPRSIGADLLNESLATWDGAQLLDKQRSADGITARLTSTNDPAYIVLDVHRD